MLEDLHTFPFGSKSAELTIPIVPKNPKLVTRTQVKFDFSYSSTTQCHLDSFNVQNWHPAFSNQTLLSHVQVEQVERVINRLDFANLHKPVLKIFRCGNQNAMTMVLSLSQDSVQIFDSGHNAHCHFTTISWCLWAWIQSCTETFANLLDASLELVSLEEDDEYRLVHVVSLFRTRFVSDRKTS